MPITAPSLSPQIKKLDILHDLMYTWEKRRQFIIINHKLITSQQSISRLLYINIEQKEYQGRKYVELVYKIDDQRQITNQFWFTKKKKEVKNKFLTADATNVQPMVFDTRTSF